MQKSQLYAFFTHTIIRMKEISNNMQNKIIIFTGGGTGGHVYPNLALIKEFEKRGFKAVYIGGGDGSFEKSIVKDVDYYSIDAIKLIRSFSKEAVLNNFKIPVQLSKSVNRAIAILKEVKPDCVFSKGGFVSLPTVIGARKLGIPVFAHESDLTKGLANKIASSYGATMFKANPHSTFKGEFVGMPLRQDLFCVDKDVATKSLGITNPLHKPVLLILGGSSGASAINDAVCKNIDNLCKNYFVLHVTGKNKNTPINHANYLRFEYANDIRLFYAVADVVVSRAGATAVFEISALNKRALFIPLPKGVSRGDQIDNASLAKEYGAIVLEQDNMLNEKLIDAINKAYHSDCMKTIANDANGKIADIVCDRLSRGEKCKNKKLSQSG